MHIFLIWLCAHSNHNVSSYCISKGIRYTRYADDLTFSGDFDIAAVLYIVDHELKYLGLRRNPKKLKVMKKSDCQRTTGIVVNEKQQVSRDYRMKIRQEVYYIQKFGLDEHLSHIGETRAHYIEHLMGKIEYALFINPADERLRACLDTIKPYKQRSVE